ncbi:hypothetical protein BGZ52_008326 [Haplosporangium bisporale]|nr:hypothetical protein BGZ52_008326 [Haplosporangium bisporale]KAI9235406.1 MAG: hypothetical protein BYD32DRAFT_421235 [Podila humilis]
MTTIQETTYLLPSSSSYSPSDYISGTASPLDFPSIHYKDSLRHRSELAKKGRSRATQSYLQKKKKQIDAEERILRKQEERRKNRSDSEENEGESETEEERDEQSEEEKNVDAKHQEKDSDDDNNTYNRSRHSKSKSGKKSTSASRQGYKSSKSGDESEDRSNTRASRRTRPEDIDLSLRSPTSNNSSESEDDSDNSNTAEPEDLIQEIEEHFRFKRNLNFKTDNDEGEGLYVSGKINATQLTSREWKQVIEKRLDAQDKGRKDKKNSRGGKSKHL